ncbi:MAG TPA: hypothetical protein VE972_01605 [Conexibacter sp.]|nr:hypothetical protein [Conexibacter sp.]
MAIGVLAPPGSVALAARSLQISNPGRMRAEGRVTFEEPEGAARMTCSLTLNGSVQEEVFKGAGTVIGTTTEGRAETCTAFGLFGATVTILATERSPLFVLYQSFLGTLPSIVGIKAKIRTLGFQMRAIGRTCLYQADAAVLFPSSLEQMRFLEEEVLEFLLQPGSTEGCPARGKLRGILRSERARTVRLV